MVNSIVRRVWAVVVPAGACALVVACDWFAGSVPQSGESDGGSSSQVPPVSDGATSGLDSSTPSDAPAPAADGEAGAESGADVVVEGGSEASDDAADAGGGDACATCVYGCFAGACTGALTFLGGTTATTTAGGTTVTLVQTTPNGTSTAGGPVSHTDGVTVSTTTQPGGEALTVTVTWGFDPAFTNPGTTVTMQLKSSTQGTDTWTGAIPAQAAGSEVYFFLAAKPTLGATSFDPSGFVHYAYAVN